MRVEELKENFNQLRNAYLSWLLKNMGVEEDGTIEEA